MLESLKFHHIGIAVYDIGKTAPFYVNAGYTQSETIIDTFQNVKICWLTKDGMPKLELLEPIDNTSPVIKTLEKNGVSPYHTCYIVENIEDAVAELRKQRYVPFSKIAPAPAINNNRVVFLFNKNVGLIELVEIKS